MIIIPVASPEHKVRSRSYIFLRNSHPSRYFLTAKPIGMILKGTKQRLVLRYLIYGVGLLLVLIAGAGFFLLSYKPAPTELVISGSAAGMGRQHGQALRFRIKLLTRVYLNTVVCQNNPALIQSRRARALESLKHWPSAYSQELQAMAVATGQEPGTLAYANSFLDFGHGQAGCRSVVIASTNVFFHAHNLDWDNLGGLARWTACIVRRRPTDGRLATVSVGFPGLIGAIDIINEKGLALSFNQIGMGRGQVSEPILILMRRVAETCSSLDQARQEINKAEPGMPFIITVSDAAAGTGLIFERTHHQLYERPVTNGWAAACNLSQGTTTGLTRLDQILATSTVSDPGELQEVLGHPEVMMACNIYSLIFDFRRNRLLLASGAIPAADEPFRSFPLFP